MKRILIFSYICAFVIALLLLTLSYTLNQGFEKYITGTVGSSLMSIVLVTFFYEQWKYRDKRTVIEEVSMRVTTKFNPCVPFKIYPPGRQEKDPIMDSLEESINNSDGKYFYTGIGMSTMSNTIETVKNRLKEAYFLIPAPELVNDVYKGIMHKSAETLTTIWDSNKTIKLVFVFLNYIPPFHIHKTSQDCWFAFLDKGNADDKSQLQKYPVTYQYKKNKDKTDDNYEMYHTIAETIEKLYDRHKDGIIYTFQKGQLLKISRNKNKEADITYQEDGKKPIVIDKETFLKEFIK